MLDTVKQFDLGSDQNPLVAGHYHFATQNIHFGDIAANRMIVIQLLNLPLLTYGTKMPFTINITANGETGTDKAEINSTLLYDNTSHDIVLYGGYTFSGTTEKLRPGLATYTVPTVGEPNAYALVMFFNENIYNAHLSITVHNPHIELVVHKNLTSPDSLGELNKVLTSANSNVMPTVLLEGSDYGTSLPIPGCKGRVFFVEVQDE